MNLEFDDNDIIINEKFLPPSGELYEVGLLYNIKLYSSDELKKDYIELFLNNPFSQQISTSIERLVNDGEIIPCFLNKKLMSIFLFKLFSQSYTKYINGYYDNNLKKVFILIDNNINIFNYTNGNNIIRTTIHETLHMAAYKNINKFINIFKDDLINFYDLYFEMIFEIKKKNKNYDTELFIRELKKFTNKQFITQKHIIDYGMLINNIYRPYSSLSKNEFSIRVYKLLSILSDIIVNPISYVNNKNKDIRFLISETLEKVYRHLFTIEVKGLCFQELYSISEVISVLSETQINNKMIRCIKNL